ncbi:HK97 gp10 family phage protein [Paenibacillus sp. FSL H7-0756]|uniref:HK97 gp10 family phage protein n=1 Tax=Paenibacillus sp. FSL H7-0756 TaxID=2954738 RepID=UPI0030FCBCF6
MSGLGSFDFSDAKKLQKNLQRMQKEFPAFMEECIRELAGRLLAKAIARTPVRTGDLRRGWQIGQVVRLPGGGVHVEIVNNVEYALYVEYGHVTRLRTGWVNGKFMLTLSEEELERELPGIMEKKLKKYIEKHMGR